MLFKVRAGLGTKAYPEPMAKSERCVFGSAVLYLIICVYRVLRTMWNNQEKLGRTYIICHQYVLEGKVCVAYYALYVAFYCQLAAFYAQYFSFNCQYVEFYTNACLIYIG